MKDDGGDRPLRPLTIPRGPYAPRIIAALTASLALAIGCESVGDSEANRDSPATLESRIRARLDSLDAETALYAKHLPSGREIAIRADRPMNALSVIKIPIMVLAFREAEAARLDLDRRHTLRPDEYRRGSGLLQTFAPGLAPTYRDLVTQMIITSDNTATDIMIEELGPDRVNALLAELGYETTRLQATTGELFRAVWVAKDSAFASLTHREVYERGFPDDPDAEERAFAFTADSSRWLGTTTAGEMGRLLEEIHRGALASSESTHEMLRILARQFYSSRLPRFIRWRARVAHKTGDWPPYNGNDVGIIDYEGGPAIVSVFTARNRGSFVRLEQTIGRIARDLIDEWR